MTFEVRERDFSKTWREMVPFLSVDVWDQSRFHKENEANRAVYRFIRDLFGRTFYKDPLKTKIEALDKPSMDEANLIPHRGEMKRAIETFLRKIPRNPSGSAHCSSCRVKLIDIPTDEQKRVVREQTAPIYQLAQKFMAKKI
jgi:hypothetical protein